MGDKELDMYIFSYAFDHIFAFNKKKEIFSQAEIGDIVANHAIKKNYGFDILPRLKPWAFLKHFS